MTAPRQARLGPEPIWRSNQSSKRAPSCATSDWKKKDASELARCKGFQCQTFRRGCCIDPALAKRQLAELGGLPAKQAIALCHFSAWGKRGASITLWQLQAPSWVTSKLFRTSQMSVIQPNKHACFMPWHLAKEQNMPRIEGVAAQDWLANDSKVSACIQATLIATINVSSVRGPHRLEAATQDAFNCKQSHSNQGTMRIARSIVPHPGSHQLKKKKNVCFQLLMLAEESCLKDKRRNHFTGQMTPVEAKDCV